MRKDNYKRTKSSRSKKYTRQISNWSSVAESQMVPIGGHKLPPLPYKYNALEPYIGAETMKIHYDKLHRNYVNKLNEAELALQKARNSNDYKLVQYWEYQLAFAGAGHYLHTIWWKSITPHHTTIREPLATEIENSFGSDDQFKEQFSAVAKSVPGPGWAMLVWAPRAWRMEILQVKSHQNNTQQDCIPLLVLDVWEHAYFLNYLNRKDEYVDMWWNIIDWETANYRLTQAKKVKWKPY